MCLFNTPHTRTRTHILRMHTHTYTHMHTFFPFSPVDVWHRECILTQLVFTCIEIIYLEKTSLHTEPETVNTFDFQDEFKISIPAVQCVYYYISKNINYLIGTELLSLKLSQSFLFHTTKFICL